MPAPIIRIAGTGQQSRRLEIGEDSGQGLRQDSSLEANARAFIGPARRRMPNATPAAFSQPHNASGFVTPTVANVSFVGKMADGDLVRSPPIPA